MTVRRSTSAETAARFAAMRASQAKTRLPEVEQQRRPTTRGRPLGHSGTCSACGRPGHHARNGQCSKPRRIIVDFAEPTLRAIYAALTERLCDGDLAGNALTLTIIATDMVATALGESTGDEPPLTDRAGT